MDQTEFLIAGQRLMKNLVDAMTFYGLSRDQIVKIMNMALGGDVFAIHPTGNHVYEQRIDNEKSDR